MGEKTCVQRGKLNESKQLPLFLPQTLHHPAAYLLARMNQECLPIGAKGRRLQKAPGETSRAGVIPRAVVLTPAVSRPLPAPGLGHRGIDARPHGCDIPAFEVGRHYFNHAHGMSKWPNSVGASLGSQSSKGQRLRYKKERPRL